MFRKPQLSLPVLLSTLVLTAVLSAPAAAQPQPAPAPPGQAPSYGPETQPQPLYPQAQPAPQPYGQQVPPPPQAPYAQPGYPQPYGQPPYAPPPAAPYARPARPSRGLMITGISILGGSYLFSVVLGLALMEDTEDECIDCRDVGRVLFVPVLGPFLAIPQVEGDGEGLLALLGVVETVGAALTVGGIVRFKNSKRRAEEQGYYSMELKSGRTLSLGMSSSRALLGPKLKLTF